MVRSTFLALSALVALAGCNGGATPAAGPAQAVAAGQAQCPRVSVLEEGAVLTRHRAGARPGPRAVELEARLADIRPRCELAPRNAGLDVTLVVQVQAQRGPALAGREAELPYFIAVTDAEGGRVLNRGSDSLRVSFGGDGRATAEGEEMMVRIPGDPRLAAERVILVGFQLTPEQLEANRRRAGR
ncbi:hypothetical protein J8J14_01150 [Roseomonas sp. SSH11]|uniref:DUF4352 domain-containing protein n=1 Tax=Pararoseomonas baculiformis TaxID=2820812 RepID=A0ABS4A8Q0_9PROT|nr:hypothetical protein [Pararoseomonas baculiformis]MBP0443372.1 hypothetical protein [Pararoseomonas baculiformis]